MSVARFTGVTATAVVPLLYCADAFEIQRECALELSLVVFRMAHIYGVIQAHSGSRPHSKNEKEQ